MTAAIIALALFWWTGYLWLGGYRAGSCLVLFAAACVAAICGFAGVPVP